MTRPILLEGEHIPQGDTGVAFFASLIVWKDDSSSDDLYHPRMEQAAKGGNEADNYV